MLTAIQHAITEVLRDRIPEQTWGKCLYIAHAVATVLHKNGLRPVIQAGSLQWPIMDRADDDGRSNTHFAYMWSPGDPASIMAQHAGGLPEMHVWVGLVESQTLIDFATRDLKKHAEACGLVWRSGDPPDYLWTTAYSLPDWVVYTPSLDATLYACRILKSLFAPPYLNHP